MRRIVRTNTRTRPTPEGRVGWETENSSRPRRCKRGHDTEAAPHAAGPESSFSSLIKVRVAEKDSRVASAFLVLSLRTHRNPSNSIEIHQNPSKFNVFF